MANSIQVDAIVLQLVEKGIITKDGFYTKLKNVQAEYDRRGLGKKIYG